MCAHSVEYGLKNSCGDKKGREFLANVPIENRKHLKVCRNPKNNFYTRRFEI